MDSRKRKYYDSNKRKAVDDLHINSRNKTFNDSNKRKAVDDLNKIIKYLRIESNKRKLYIENINCKKQKTCNCIIHEEKYICDIYECNGKINRDNFICK
jgi:hypothetical protein